MDREKVIAWLNEIVNTLGSFTDDSEQEVCQLAKDALSLLKEDQHQIWEMQELNEYLQDKLKEQEAVLLTFEEVKNHFHVPIKLLGDIEKYVDFENDIEPLYLECDIEDAWTVHWRTYDNTKEYLESWGKDYGKTWRCWTKKPTEEQKRSVKWE